MISPEAEHIEQLVVDTLEDLADRSYPLPEPLGPGFVGVAFGRMDELRSLFFKPAPVVFGSLKALIGHIQHVSQELGSWTIASVLEIALSVLDTDRRKCFAQYLNQSFPRASCRLAHHPLDLAERFLYRVEIR